VKENNFRELWKYMGYFSKSRVPVNNEKGVGSRVNVQGAPAQAMITSMLASKHQAVRITPSGTLQK
jgi:hypothetical protein